MCLAKPNSLEIRRNFEGEIYVLKPEEGGRAKPFFTGYRPQCFIRTADTAVDLTLPKDMQMAMPGDNVTVAMKLNYPLPIVKGQRFALREGGKTVAAGVITKLLEDSEADIKEEEERVAKAKTSKWAQKKMFDGENWIEINYSLIYSNIINIFQVAQHNVCAVKFVRIVAESASLSSLTFSRDRASVCSINL